MATILSVAMMLRYSFAMGREADLLERAVAAVLAEGVRTGDILRPGCKLASTEEMGDAVLRALSVHAAEYGLAA